MANNLFDTIQQNRQLVAGQQPQATNETSKIQGLLQAKSGRAVGGGQPISNLGEQSANSQTSQQMGQLNTQAGIEQAGQEQQSRGIQQQETEATTGIAQQNKFNTIQNKLKTNSILSDLERSKGQIDENQKQAGMEQAAFQLRMQNTSYVDNLQREGDKARLDDKNTFDEELARDVMGANADLMKQQLNDKSIVNADDREFQKAMATMTDDQAWMIYKNQANGEQERRRYELYGKMIGLGAGAASGMKSDSGSSSSGGNSGTGSEVTGSER